MNISKREVGDARDENGHPIRVLGAAEHVTTIEKDEITFGDVFNDEVIPRGKYYRASFKDDSPLIVNADQQIGSETREWSDMRGEGARWPSDRWGQLGRDGQDLESYFERRSYDSPAFENITLNLRGHTVTVEVFDNPPIEYQNGRLKAKVEPIVAVFRLRTAFRDAHEFVDWAV